MGCGGDGCSRGPAASRHSCRSKRACPLASRKQTVDDARKLMLEVQDARRIDLTWPEALSQVSGKPVLTDTQRILESAPQSRTRMQEFFGDRPQQFDQAALNEFGQDRAGELRTPSQASDRRLAARPTRPLATCGARSMQGVRAVLSRTRRGVLLTPQEMNGRARPIPGWKEARAAVRNDPQLNSYVSHLPDNSVGFLNEVKKYFDQSAKNSGSKVQPRRQPAGAGRSREGSFGESGRSRKSSRLTTRPSLSQSSSRRASGSCSRSSMAPSGGSPRRT
jgi:hypothetical protein